MYMYVHVYVLSLKTYSFILYFAVFIMCECEAMCRAQFSPSKHCCQVAMVPIWLMDGTSRAVKLTSGVNTTAYQMHVQMMRVGASL